MRTFREVAAEYPDIAADDCIIDALCMKLVQRPEQFDVLVAPNLYGDIISDLCAGLVGGLGFAPSANIGDSTCIYEAVHGSAPDIAGQDKANPSAILMAFAMMLNDLGETEKAARLNDAILAQVAEGQGRDRGYRRHRRNEGVYAGGYCTTVNKRLPLRGCPQARVGVQPP